MKGTEALYLLTCSQCLVSKKSHRNVHLFLQHIYPDVMLLDIQSTVVVQKLLTENMGEDTCRLIYYEREMTVALCDVGAGVITLYTVG